MSIKFDSLKDEINNCFYDIVGILNEVIKHRTDSFSGMIDISMEIQKGSESFVGETDKIVGVISSDINHKIDNLDMDKMKQDIIDATSTFIEITEELELLSYNTICRTMALGDKGATITHISKEIKKYSTTVKTLLEVISVNFNDMFERFKNVADHLVDNKLVQDDSSLNVEAIDEIMITSDVSILIENSQFHDIFMQELEVIQEAIENINYNDAYEAGIVFGKYEKAMGKLDVIKFALQDKLVEIKDVMGDFIYTFNTDLQNIVGQTNILRSELNRVDEMSESICSTISMLKNTIDQSKDVLHKTKNSVGMLAKQSKTFRNLVVITAVEVARINDESLRRVVFSMTQTETELNELINKLFTNIDMWNTLRSDFMGTFSGAENDMQMLCHSNVAEDRKKILGDTHSLDGQLEEFKKIFTAEMYVNFFDSNSNKLAELFDVFNESVQETFMELNDSLSEEILSDEEFTRGRNDAEFKDILAHEEDQSTIEFF
ncbi:MAG: hypothetical protein C0603_10405 [Denitrovibrio sp.]|nr:MAG: hypothetical protein C0603_10405 [Denitrovibrio sp.]